MNTYWAVMNFTSPAHLRLYLDFILPGYAFLHTELLLGWAALGASVASRTITAGLAVAVILEITHTWGFA